jgi:ABC-2 type transport system permease protein
MSSWAEERRLGTDELLLTLPFREHEIVIGKYLASVLVLIGILVLTVFVPLTVAPLGQFERGQIIGQYIGTALLGCAGLAIGQLVSSFFRNQISAFIVTALVLLGLTLINQVTAFADVSTGAGSVFTYLSLDRHYRGFVRGIVDTRDLVYFVAIVALALYGNAKRLALGRWR